MGPLACCSTHFLRGTLAGVSPRPYTIELVPTSERLPPDAVVGQPLTDAGDDLNLESLTFNFPCMAA